MVGSDTLLLLSHGFSSMVAVLLGGPTSHGIQATARMETRLHCAAICDDQSWPGRCGKEHLAGTSIWVDLGRARM